MCGVVGFQRGLSDSDPPLTDCVSGSGLGWSTGVGESPVRESMVGGVVGIPE